MDGWMEAKAGLRIAYSNQQTDPLWIRVDQDTLAVDGIVFVFSSIPRQCLGMELSENGTGEFFKPN